MLLKGGMESRVLYLCESTRERENVLGDIDNAAAAGTEKIKPTNALSTCTTSTPVQ